MPQLWEPGNYKLVENFGDGRNNRAIPCLLVSQLYRGNFLIGEKIGGGHENEKSRPFGRP